jgi:hypothetical protein
MLRRTFGFKIKEVKGRWKKCIIRSFIICSSPNYNDQIKNGLDKGR